MIALVFITPQKSFCSFCVFLCACKFLLFHRLSLLQVAVESVRAGSVIVSTRVSNLATSEIAAAAAATAADPFLLAASLEDAGLGKCCLKSPPVVEQGAPPAVAGSRDAAAAAAADKDDDLQVSAEKEENDDDDEVAEKVRAPPAKRGSAAAMEALDAIMMLQRAISGGGDDDEDGDERRPRIQWGRDDLDGGPGGGGGSAKTNSPFPVRGKSLGNSLGSGAAFSSSHKGKSAYRGRQRGGSVDRPRTTSTTATGAAIGAAGAAGASASATMASQAGELMSRPKLRGSSNGRPASSSAPRSRSDEDVRGSSSERRSQSPMSPEKDPLGGGGGTGGSGVVVGPPRTSATLSTPKGRRPRDPSPLRGSISQERLELAEEGDDRVTLVGVRGADAKKTTAALKSSASSLAPAAADEAASTTMRVERDKNKDDDDDDDDNSVHVVGGGGGREFISSVQAHGSTPMAALEAAARAAPVPARTETVATLAADASSVLQPFAKMLIAGEDYVCHKMMGFLLSRSVVVLLLTLT